MPGKTHEQIEPFDCDKHCRNTRGDGKFRDRDRAARGCTRIDLPQVEPNIAPQLIRIGWLGREPVPGVSEEDGQPVRNPLMPLERISDGCPGGWYRCRFVWSLHPYLRVRCEGGMRVSNPMLDRCDDEFVLQCVQVYEHHQERAAAHRLEAMRDAR